MKRINKILILFIFMISLSFFAVWEILQSKWVATQVSTFATKYIENVLEADIEFNNLQFNLFPPGAEVRDVAFNGVEGDFKFRLEASSVGLYFNPFDIFNTSFVVDELRVEDANIYVEQVGRKKIIKNEANSNTVNLDHFKLLREIPLNKIKALDVVFGFNEYQIYTPEFEIKNFRKNIKISGSVERVDLRSLLNINQVVDSISISSIIDRNTINLNYLKVKSGLAFTKITGIISNYVSKNIKYNLSANSILPINFIHQWIEFKDIGVLSQGIATVDSTIKGSGSRFQNVNKISLKNFVTDFAYGDIAESEIHVDEKRIVFKKFKMKSSEQEIKLLEPFEFLNFNTMKFVEESIVADAKNLRVNNFLRYLREDVSILKGSVSGKIKFDLYEKSFKFTTLDKVKINELILQATESFQVLNLNDFYIERGEFVLDHGKFRMDLFATQGETNFNLLAKISKDHFELKMPTGYLELDKFNHIAGMNMGGRGTFSFDLLNNDDGLVLYTKNDFKQFSLEGYHIDKVKADVDYYLERDSIEIKKLKAASGKSRMNAIGEINYNTMNIDGVYEVEKMNFSELKKILRPILGEVKLTANEIHGDWDINGRLYGKASLKGIRTVGELRGKNNYFFDENLDRFRFSYKLDKGLFKVDNFKAKKGKGILKSFFSYNIVQNSLKFKTELKNISLQDFSYYSKFPLSLRSNANGSVYGSFLNNEWSFGSKLTFKNSRVFSTRYADSIFNIDYDKDKLICDVNIFDGKIKLDSRINLNKSKKDSIFNLDVNFKNIKELLGVFSGVDLINSDIRGAVSYRFRSTLESEELTFKHVSSNLKNFNLKKDPISIQYINPQEEISIEDKVIKKWGMNVRGRGLYIISNGEGNLSNNYKAITQLKIDASIVEIFNNIITKANGSLRGKIVNGRNDKKDLYEAYLASNNLTLTSKFLPTSLAKTDMKISYKESILEIEKFTANLLSGKLEVGGSVNLKSVIPDVNIRYNFRDAGLTVLKKSSLIFSGSGSLIGKNFPYSLAGDFQIQKFNIVNELTEFGLGGSSTGQNEIDFLPGNDSIVSNQILNFNLNVVTREPIYIRNSLTDLGFVGNLQVLGGEKDPRLSGKINLAPRNNKVTFKNNEFSFTKGNVVFVERNDFSNPELDFFATSSISDYKVNVSLLGPVKDFNMKLSSEPSLSQSDVLSLIAFGYTEDLSNNLTDAEKESMTRAGVGSIIFDSFKINETLKNEFGLQVKLGTEISQDESSYLSGRNAEGNSVGRVRSATTFEVKKKVNDDVSLSIISTVGASSSQKQAINLNYNLNDSVSVEGVYESKTTDDQETINDDNSFGADVKWRWPFK